MSSMMALLWFTGWTLLLVTLAVTYRVALVLTFKKPANAWPRGEKHADDPGLVTRLEHAHANCVENLPIFAVLVLAASLMGHSGQIDPVAPYVVYARLAQSVTHLIGTSALLVFVRANFYLIQVGLFAFMLWRLLA